MKSKKKATQGGARAGAGRKKTIEDGKTFAFYLPESMIGKLDKLAKENETSRNKMVLEVLEHGLKLKRFNREA